MALSTKSHTFKTFLVLLIWISKGLCYQIVGPAMIDLKLIFNTNFEAVTWSISGRGAGGFLGAVMGGVVTDRFNRNQCELYIAVCTTLLGCSAMAIPYVGDISYVWAVFFSIGCCSGTLNVAGSRLILNMWKEKSPTKLPILHMGFGIGALLVPIICSPFLAVVESVSSDKNGQEPVYKVLQASQVHYAFILVGLITMMASIPFYIFYCNSASNRKQEENKDTSPAKRTLMDIVNPGTYADGNVAFGFSMFVLLFVYFFNLVGMEQLFASFVRTFSVDVFKFSKMESSYLNTSFWLSLTVGRFLGSIIAHYVPVRTHLISQALLHSFSVTAMYLYASSSRHALWILTVMEGLSVSAMYPLGVAFGNTQIEVSGFCLMVIVLAGSFGDFTYMWMSGRLYDMYGPPSIIYVCCIAAVILLGTAGVFRLCEKPPKDTSKANENFTCTNLVRKILKICKLS